MTDAMVAPVPAPGPAGSRESDGVEPLLRVEDLSVTFRSGAGPVTAVRGISYDVRPGEVLGIVGESGSGKSVSSLAVMGLLPGTATITGSATFQGRQLLGLGDKQISRIRGSRLAMVFQDPLSALTPVYTVGDQIAETIRVHQGLRRDAARERAIELLDLVGIPNPRQRSKSFPHEFSGGMRQRVMIAMAIANDPALIIADEPTTALDVTIQAQILEVLQTAREVTGAAIIMITHDLGVIAGFADRMMVMYAGRVVESGVVETVYQQPRMPYTMGLLGSIPRLDAGERQALTPIEGVPPSMVSLPVGCPFAPRCPMRIDSCEQTEPALLGVVSDDAGHLAACHRSEEIARDGLTNTDVFVATTVPEAPPAARLPREQRPVVLEVRDLVKEYPLTTGGLLRRKAGSLQAVAGVSFDIREGETLGLVGESGCGKTTTIMEILELAKPTSGTIAVLGKDTAAMSGKERFAIRRDLQVVFQDPMASLDPRLPVSDILAEPMITHGVPAAERDRRIRDLLRLVGLRPEHADRYPAKFSGGQRQRIGIARALALEPKVLVLDEPVSALDVSIQAGVINLLDRLKAELGLSYLFVAHDLSVVRHIADRVAVMYLGRIVEIGTADQVFENPTHPYTQALLSAIPLPDPVKERSRRRILLTGDLPSAANPPSGCRFRTRCSTFAHQLDDDRRRRCLDESPELTGAETTGEDHEVACHYPAPAAVI
ncbi:ABC transporter ATP-binding protein [Actinoplanes palleronii]|uniref:Oligopeptide ABC transporter ATP-binding protein OppF n=2 Tax=Actinoplanes palleronii TaxID=113570 RepID=A0ABQ4B1I8_9ACTN|nr:ABC transporter ATP-binding protein [Actinoplanes palleronii]GIE64536.1 oligopeptide ABC transporter ATP-binding protein OppF [Actinoplanes palleronii]